MPYINYPVIPPGYPDDVRQVTYISGAYWGNIPASDSPSIYTHNSLPAEPTLEPSRTLLELLECCVVDKAEA